MAEVTCSICGRVFLAGNNSARYCGDECRKVAKQEYNREQMRKYTKKVKQEKEKSYRAPKKSLSEVAREAREAGMDYGDYVALHKL